MIRPVILACLVALAAVGAPASVGCVPPASQRESTIHVSFVTVDAGKEAYLAYDAHAQDEIVASAVSLEDGKAKLAEYRAKRGRVVKALTVAYMAIATAARLNDDRSLASVVAAISDVIATVRALTGGAS